MIRLLAILLGVVHTQILLGGPEPELFTRQRSTLERVLAENIVPFWLSGTLDRELGGYRLNHDPDGRWKGEGPKGIVTQARCVWFFARLYQSRFGRQEHLDAAEHGYRFLRDRLWDKRFGGFFWEVDASGVTATRPNKHLYGQSFGLYALSEYAIASGDTGALELARELFRLLEFHAHDSVNGGYREFFEQDWANPSFQAVGYMGVGPEVKLMNTHLHLMEALTAYLRASRDPLARERLLELIAVQSNAVVRKEIGACTDKYRLTWEPLAGDAYDQVSYGHDVENVWLLMDACRAAGVTDGPFRDLYTSLMRYSLRYGFDWDKGGFFDRGSFGRTADHLDKIWWVQAEGLVATLRMAVLTGSETYAQAFGKTLQWITEQQTDWEGGDWFSTVTASGQKSGDKAGLWKSPYHNGRAVLECISELDHLISDSSRKVK